MRRPAEPSVSDPLSDCWLETTIFKLADCYGMEPDEEPTQSNISGGRSAAVSLHKRKTGVVNYAEAENDSDSESEDDLFQKKPKAKAGGSKKKRRIPGFDSGTDDEFEDDDDDDLTRETGLISKIYVENFMSHKKFTVKFGKSVNFVTGPNGSGKSAIVAALQLCLGSRMTQTGRGSNMSSLIRQGSPGPAIVRVTLVNDGADAYRTDKYGNRIIIERKIIKGGGSTYKLLSSDGTVRCFSFLSLLCCLVNFRIYVCILFYRS